MTAIYILIVKFVCCPYIIIVFILNEIESRLNFSIVYFDVWGPTSNTHNDHRYFVIFRWCISDDFNILLKRKDEVSSAYKIFRECIKTQFQTKIHIFLRNLAKWVVDVFVKPLQERKKITKSAPNIKYEGRGQQNYCGMSFLPHR